MKNMRIRCHDREHADRVIVAARKMGYRPFSDYKADKDGRWDTLQLRSNGSGSFWGFDEQDYPEYRLYGDHFLPVSEGWIENNNGHCPVVEGTMIDVLYRDGETEKGIPALSPTGYHQRSARHWSHDDHELDIIAYRISEVEEREDTPCEKHGLSVGQWVWRQRRFGTLSTGWVKLTRDDGTKTPYFYDPRRERNTCGELQYIDFSRGIYDAMPDWNPVEEVPDPKADERHRLSDDACEALGWMLAECCNILDKGEDPREADVPDMIERCRYDLKVKPKIDKEIDDFITATGVNDTPDVRSVLTELLKRGISLPNCD